MRFARVIQTHDQCDAKLVEQVEAADLDILQLDYDWPHRPPKAGELAVGFLEQFSLLHKTMYLRPELHLVTNAGAGNVVGCAEAVAEYLCEHRDAELPLSVIRGDNLLPSLEQLQREGVELRNPSTGKLLREMEKPPLSARVELGAGPLATAWQEGARIIIAGNYDFAAPITAAAKIAFGWSWEDYDELAQAAVAARMFGGVWQLDPTSEPLMETCWNKFGWEEAAESLQNLEVGGSLSVADVECDLNQASLERRPHYQFEITGVRGRAAPLTWQFRVTFLSGYRVDTKLRLLSSSKEAKTVANEIGQRITAAMSAETKFQIEPIRFAQQHWWILLHYEHEDQENCREFIDVVNQLPHSAGLQDIEHIQVPSCEPVITTWSCPIPREIVSISVDTRPAKEWR